MPSKNPKFTIDIKPKNPKKQFGKVIKDFRNFNKDMMREVKEDVLIAARLRTPVASGRTWSAWTVTGFTGSDGSSTIDLRNPSQAIHFLQSGTMPSSGMFIFRIGKRVTRGVHPGMQPTRILDNIERDALTITLDHVRKLPFKAKRSVSRNFR